MITGRRALPQTPARAASLSTAVVKVARPALPWREVYEVEAVGVAVHRAILENA